MVVVVLVQRTVDGSRDVRSRSVRRRFMAWRVMGQGLELRKYLPGSRKFEQQYKLTVSQ